MSSFSTSVLMIIWLSFLSALSDLTRERFEEFKAEIIELVSCGTGSGRDCTEGLDLDHPDVSIYDIEGNPFANLNMIGGVTRLAFHDCVGVNVNKIKSGNTNFFTDPTTNGEAGGCNGCIGIDNPDNDNLLDAAIDPLEPICNDYKPDGMSRADCWSLAATITLEWSASFLDVNRAPPFSQLIDPAIIEGDIPYYYGRSDCINGYESGSSSSVDFPFSNPDGVFFEFPDPALGWTHVAEFFKSRFGWNNKNNYFTNRDIISLVSGGHSVGRGHERISGYAGNWDFAPQVFENEFVSALFGEDYIGNIAIFGINPNMNQSIVNPTEPNGKPAFHLKMSDIVNQQFGFDQPPYDPPVLTLNQALNTDISMVYDLSWYIENDKGFSIDCNTRADLICGPNQVILTAPRGSTSNFNRDRGATELGEQYQCGENEDCCPYLQCPMQCEGGITEFNRLIANDLIDTVDDDSNCPAAIAKKYSMLNQPNNIEINRNFGLDFATAFAKMITIGYVNKQSGEVLLKTVPDTVPDAAYIQKKRGIDDTLGTDKNTDDKNKNVVWGIIKNEWKIGLIIGGLFLFFCVLVGCIMRRIKKGNDKNEKQMENAADVIDGKDTDNKKTTNSIELQSI